MKRTLKAIFFLVLAITLMLSLSMIAFAADSYITFEGKSTGFAFEPGSEYTATDLFDNFKNVMPGDVLKETITVKNNAKDCDYIKLYMRAVAHNEVDNPLSTEIAEAGETVVSMTDFLAQLSMKVYDKETLIYDAAPDELDGLANDVLLGTYRSGDINILTVELTIPIQLGNKYANREGEVDWIFKVEAFDDPVPTPQPTESPTPQITPSSPSTGDNSQVRLYWWLLSTSAAVWVILLFGYKKKQPFILD